MREVIIQRIEEIKKRNNGFKICFRWNRNVTINGVHISEADFHGLNDNSLLAAFELIIMRNSMQM